MDFASLDTYLSKIIAHQETDLTRTDSLRLNEADVYGLLDILGVNTCPAVTWRVGSAESARRAWAQQAVALADDRRRILLKVVGREILHKTDVGGVRVLRWQNDAEAVSTLLDAAEHMLCAVRKAGVDDAVEGMMATAYVPHHTNQPGQEVLLSLRQDPAFGPCVVVGIGGTLTEWYGQGGDRNCSGGSTLIFPANGLDAASVGEALVSHPMVKLLCTPSRLYAEAPLPVTKLVAAVLALADLGCHCGPRGESPYTLEEIEINPAVVSQGNLVALDGVGLVSRRKWEPAGRTLARIDNLLQPRSAVVMGVSAKGNNPGRIILDNLLRSEGLSRENLYVVHQRETDIAGVACCRDVASLPQKCDLAVVSIPAEGALAAITDLVTEDKAASIILIPGGFAESGHSDLAGAIEDILRVGHRRRQGGPVMVGGNCLGIVSRDNYNTFFLPEYKLPFRPGRGRNLALVSQSGAYLVTFASNYDGIIQPRASISFGNQMDLTVADFLCHYNETPEVDVIACYVEGFRPGDGDRFLSHCRRARQLGKRVIVFKAGKTALGAKAAASHTASLAGDYAVARACLQHAGATVAETLDEFEDLIKTFTLLAGKVVNGDRTGIISNAGFECSTVMDRLDGLTLAQFDAETQARLDEILPAFAHRSNPIDCTPMTATAAFCGSCEAILACETVDVAILSSVPVTPALDNLPADPQRRHGENLEAEGSQPRRMVDIIAGSAKPAVVVVDSGKIYDPMCRLIERAGVPVFRKIDRAAHALAAFCRS